MWSVPSRRRDPSTDRRMVSGRESGTMGSGVFPLAKSKVRPNLVDSTTWSRTGARAWPTRVSLAWGSVWVP